MLLVGINLIIGIGVRKILNQFIILALVNYRVVPKNVPFEK